MKLSVAEHLLVPKKKAQQEHLGINLSKASFLSFYKANFRMGAACSSGSTADARPVHSASRRRDNSNVSIGQREDDSMLSINNDRIRFPPVIDASIVSIPAAAAAAPQPRSSTSSSSTPATNLEERSVAERNIEAILERTRSGVALDASAGFSLGAGPHHSSHHQDYSTGGNLVGVSSGNAKLSEDVSMRLDMLVQISKSGSSRVDGYSMPLRSSRNSQRQRSTTYFGDQLMTDSTVQEF
ncbi:Hypothetical protein, putative [Bodo saltans]|uniref:Uncharacterized protein n=1 Tax=Bodo saltans TaxID=75058 RepID=A0A0S4JBP3_BODSA|nr:Hypothetical protein, putative [Bodo saltans]|eukprot:CUG86867.1 Hypothetical protein, putative [Bodo saltans]